jgi:hypothetical protein
LLDLIEELYSLVRRPKAAHGWQQHRRHEGHTADPKHDRRDMKGSRNRNIIRRTYPDQPSWYCKSQSNTRSRRPILPGQQLPHR